MAGDEATPAVPVLVPVRRRGPRRLPVAVVAVALLLPLALAGGAAAVWESLHTETGTRWWLTQLATRLPGVALQQPQGALLGAGSRFSLARLTLNFGRNRVQVDGLRAVGLQLGDWRWQAPYLHLQAREIAAERVDIAQTPAPQPASPTVAPADLQLPLSARIESLRIERLQLPGVAAPIEGLAARVEAGDVHRIDALALRWQGLVLDGQAKVDATAPMALQARLGLRSDPQAEQSALPAWARDLTMKLQANGPLARFDVQAALAMQSQRLEALARVTAFEPLPLSQLDARFEKLDLARLLAPFGGPAPTTALDGTVAVQLGGAQPLAVRAQVKNALPGRWDQQRAPLRELDLQASGTGSRWTIERARLQLASDLRTAAGTVDASGSIDGRSVDLRLVLDGLLPNGLDQRAPALRLGGPIELKHEPGAPDAAFGRIAFKARLAGQLVGSTRPARLPQPLRDAVQLALAGHASPTELRVDTLSARAGAARLEGKTSARRVADRWDTEADLTLADFDPALWWPGEPGAAWRGKRNAINGSASLRAQIPAASADTAALLAALKGTLSADLSDSALAGQPLALKLRAEADGSGVLTANGNASAAGNSAVLALRLRPRQPAGGGADEAFELKLDAPALAALAPVAELAGIRPLAGKLKLEARAEGALGTWLPGGQAGSPLVTRGSVQVDALQLGSTTLETAGGDWDATLPGGAAAAESLSRAAVKARFALTRLRVPGLLIPSASLQADGTLADHRATLTALLRQPPPASGEAGPEPVPLALESHLEGRWQAGASGGPSSWRARLPELALRPAAAVAAREGGALPATGSQAPSNPAPLPLVIARDLAFELQQGENLLRWQMAPGSADILGAQLRWSALRWQRSGTAEPELELQAEVEPFVVAQLLQRLQPDFGWAGDLKIGAKASVRSTPSVTAQVEIARTGGDLQVNELGIVQSLGLSDVSFKLNAEAGLWRMTQLVAGANLGRVIGAQTVRTDARALWPAAEAPVEGALRALVDNLGTWGAWVPAGWRLGGQIDATLLIGGRFGAPELTGEVKGSALALRNSLEGVALSDGEVDARFEGDTARLNRLRFKAGEGELRATGDARLGEQPQARIDLVAERATLLGRVDRRVVASGKASAVLIADKIAIEGTLRADEGLVDISRGDAPSLGDDVTVKRGGSAPKAQEPQGERRAPRTVDLKLALNFGERFRLRGRGIDTRLEGDLRLTTPNGKLAASGEIRTVDGTYEAYGQKLAIERGVITFVGDIGNPRLDISALRANTDTRVGVLVGGNVLSPRVSLFSDPELPATEKLALLVTGKSYDSLGGADTAVLQRAAFALLAGDSTSSFDVARLLQLDELSLRQSDGVVRDTVVTVGKQLSDRVYIGYERGLSATAGNWQLIYRIAQRFTLRAQSGEDPAVDLIWLFRWN